MLDFLRSDLDDLVSYTPHPGGGISSPLDRVDTNETPYDLPPELKAKLAKIYQEEIETNRYPDGSHANLKAKIANYVNEASPLTVKISADNISVGNGSDELIRSLLIATCLGNEGKILVANPTFSMYAILARSLGIPVVSVGRSPENFEMDLEQSQKLLEQTPKTPLRAVFVVHPNSPTANALNARELNWLRSIPQRQLVVIDEAYFEFNQSSLVGELAEHPNWVILRTFSKAFRLASLRVGYAIAHPQIIAALEKIRLPYNLPAFSQTAAEIALDNRSLLLASIPEILTEREKLYQNLSHHSILKVWPSQANFLYLRYQNPDFGDRELAVLTQALKLKGTLLRHTGGGLRLTVGTPAENRRSSQRLQEWQGD